MAPGAATISATDASVVVDNGVVKFYFATGKADLAPGAEQNKTWQSLLVPPS